MKQIALAELKNRLSHYLHEAEKEPLVVTRHGQPAGVLIGFADEDDWFDYRLENDPAFLARVAKARQDLREGKGVPWEVVKAEDDRRREAEAAGETAAPPRRRRKSA